MTRVGLWASVLVLLLVTGAGVLTAAEGSGGGLFEAVRNDDHAAVVALLRGGVDVNAREEDGGTALDWAAMRSNIEISTLLLNHGANPNLTNEQGIGPLCLAIKNGSAPLARLLLEKGANPNIAREDGETALMTATHLGQTGVMKLLLDRGADINARDKKFGQTALMWAAGHPAAMRLLLDRHADVHIASKVWDVTATIYTPTTSTIGKTGIPWNNDGVYASKMGGQNALLFAVQKHDLESARMLLDAGVDVNVTAGDGTTPLLAALYKWDPLGKEFIGGKGAPAPNGSSSRFSPGLAMARMLLDRGAKVNVADGAGYTPLHGAALAVSMLTNTDKDRSAYGGGRRRRRLAGQGGGAPLPQAQVDEALAMVRRLLDSGADPNRQTEYPTSGPVGDVRLNPAPPGSSAFHIAADSRSLALVRLLADRGANPNLLRKDGHTPFSVAVLADDVPIAKEMVARGADLKMIYSPTDHFADPVKPISLPRANQTILHIAAGALAPEMVTYLYSLGVPLGLKNSMGETPLDLADHQERYHEARAREAAEDDPKRVVVRDTSTTDAIKKLLAQSSDQKPLPDARLQPLH